VSQRIGKWRKYPPEFRRAAIERMKTCDNVSELARELGVRRKWLYQWSEQARDGQTDPVPIVDAKPESSSSEARLQQQVQQLESLVARQNLEIDFFKGALQRIEQRRRNREAITAPASTSKSEA
jgi:transposase